MHNRFLQLSSAWAALDEEGRMILCSVAVQIQINDSSVLPASEYCYKLDVPNSCGSPSSTSSPWVNSN